jgi:hypothetical protein
VSDQDSTAVPGAALSAEERAELEQLRAEVASLRSQATAAAVPSETVIVAPARRPRQRWRSVVATLLIVIACILAPLAGVAVWTKNLVTDTDRYVATVAPLARDPAIQNAVADKITAVIFANVDCKRSPTRLSMPRRARVASEGGRPTACVVGPMASGVQALFEPRLGKWSPATRSRMPG